MTRKWCTMGEEFRQMAAGGFFFPCYRTNYWSMRNRRIRLIKPIEYYLQLQCFFLEIGWNTDYGSMMSRFQILYGLNLHPTLTFCRKTDWSMRNQGLGRAGRHSDKILPKILQTTHNRIQLICPINQKIWNNLEASHTTYSWNIKWQKCAGMVCAFLMKSFKKISWKYEKKIVGADWKLPAK